MHKDTKISQNRLKELLEYNPLTGVLLWKTRDVPSFDKVFAGKPALNTLTKNGYLRGKLMGRNIMASRVIFKIQTGNWPTKQVDHKNGVRTDNKWKNLRQLTNAENAQNQGINKNNTSGHMGVSPNGKGWVAKIGDNYLGFYLNKKDAINARSNEENKVGWLTRTG